MSLERLRAFWGGWPPILKALGAQALALGLLLPLLMFLPRPLPFWPWPLAQGFLAALLAGWWGLGPWWRAFQVLLPAAAAWQLTHAAPGWLWPALLLALLLVQGGGLLSRVPLYASGPEAWEALAGLLPPEAPWALADLGAGLGGLLTHLARERPAMRFVGVEASPLVWLWAWLRALPLGRRCQMRLGSLWRLDLAPFQVVHAFLSPAPMAELWDKARSEMAPGSLLVSHSFEIPGVPPERRIPLHRGRTGACLLLYRIPGGCPAGSISQDTGPQAEKA